MLFINPDECIDCGVCEPECPVEAIKPADDSNIKWQEINRELSLKSNNINRKKDAHPEADNAKNESGKFDKYFKENL